MDHPPGNPAVDAYGNPVGGLDAYGNPVVDVYGNPVGGPHDDPAGEPFDEAPSGASGGGALKPVLLTAAAAFLIGMTGIMALAKVRSRINRVEVEGMALGLDDLRALGFEGDDQKAARIFANESSVVATLRDIHSAQRAVQAAGTIDTDVDGVGEFAFLGELAGSDPVRVPDPSNSGAAAGSYYDRIDPPMLATSFAAVEADARGDGSVKRAGYRFKVLLAGSNVGEAPGGGAKEGDLATWNADACEKNWRAYAWPVERGVTGMRAFYIDQAGKIKQHAEPDSPYGVGDGPGSVPPHDAATSQDFRFWQAFEG